MNDTDWAWVAGIIDGEGSMGYYTNGRNKSKKRVLVQVGNTDYRIISKLKELCGGITYEVTRKDRPNSKRIWTWRLYGKALMAFLKGIEPYLVSKKQKAIKMRQYL